MMQDGECWERLTSVPPIIGNACGFLPTPRASVATHGICWKRAETGDHRSQIEDFLAWLSLNNGGRRTSGRTVNPDFQDWLMVWPAKWTALERLETDRFQEWLRSHGSYWNADESADEQRDRSALNAKAVTPGANEKADESKLES
jgi:hypothetical protein